MSREPNIVRYVREQLAQMARAPAMWGSPECLELQYLQLLETWLVAVRPDLDERNPRHVLDAYERFRARNGYSILTPLSMQLDDVAKLAGVLAVFQTALAPDLQPHNPFERNDLVLGLTMKLGVHEPSSSIVTSYLDELRRSLRGTLRPPGKRGGRSPKEIEILTEFEVPSVAIDPAVNGTPAQVLFSLRQRHPPQVTTDHSAERSVQDAIAHLVVAAEWASSEKAPQELAAQIPEVRRRQRVAFEAMRLVPRGEVEEVRLGGRIVARFEAVRLVAAARPRLVEALAAGQTTARFEAEGVLRAADLDRASIRVHADDGTKYSCLVASEAMDAIRQYALDSRVHVRGERIHGLHKTPLIVVDHVELKGEPEVEDYFDDEVAS